MRVGSVNVETWEGGEGIVFLVWEGVGRGGVVLMVGYTAQSQRFQHLSKSRASQFP